MKTFGSGRSAFSPRPALICVAVLTSVKFAGTAALAGPVYSVTNLGTLAEGSDYAPTSINDAGQIVGTYDNGVNLGFFLYNNGQMTQVPQPGSANAIDNNGLIVGQSDLTASYTAHAFQYVNGTMTDLNQLIPASSGWVLENALGINDAGQIVGIGTFDGQERAFLLTPDPTPVPEPATLWIFGLAGAGYGLRRVARQRCGRTTR